MKIATGDSFTYGEELEDRTVSAWPALLGYENHGLRGASNEYIFRTSAELAPVATNMIVAWSECTRHEIYTHNPVSVMQRYTNFTGIIQVNSRWTDIPWFRELYGKYSEEQHQFLRTVVNMVTLQDVLTANNVDYRYCSAFSNQVMFKKYKDDTDIAPWIARLNTDKFIGFPDEGFVEWAYETPRGKGGHPLEYGHQKIAERLKQEI